jgi:hypothetical protein
MALEECGDLGKLIKKESYYLPKFVIPDYTEEQGPRLNALKSYQRKQEKMEDDSPKLYGLICQHMSAKSKDEVAQDSDYEVWSDAKDPERLWQDIVKTHKVDCMTQ